MQTSVIKRKQGAGPTRSSAICKASLVGFTIVFSACTSVGPALGPDFEFAEAGDELLVVDCLLPGQVRQLNSTTRFVTSKRPIKTSGQDCANRGGEFTAFDRADYKTALKVWLARGADGDAEAQNYVGEIYEKGLGVEPDYTEAKKWYQRAAKQDFSRAYINLANLYEKGLGVNRDPVLAVNLYRKASGIDWDEIGYASTLIPGEQLQTEIVAQQQKLDKLREEQSQLQANLEATQRQLAQETVAAAEQVNANQADTKNTQEGLATQQPVKLLPPEILIYDPAIAMTRQGPVVLLDAQSEFINVVGKISTPAGLNEAYLNGERLKIDNDGLFFSILPVSQLPDTVKIFAADSQQTSSEFGFTLQSTSPDINPAHRRVAQNAVDPVLGQYHALVIGNSEYNSFPEYPAGAAAALEVKTLLEEKYGFQSKLLLNATRYQVLFAIDQLRSRLKPEDNLLIYFAGRCETDVNQQPAYWLPVDAEPQSNSRWVSNSAVSDLINTIQSKRVMVVSDACYAGTFTTAAISRPALPENTEGYRQWMESMQNVRARTVLASGTAVTGSMAAQPSVFTQTFLEVLRENDRIIDGNSIYVEMLKSMAASGIPELALRGPTYEAIKYAGHEAGEFFFKPVI